MTATIPAQRVYEAHVSGNYAGQAAYTAIDSIVHQALQEGVGIRINLTRAVDGAQTEFYGALWNACIQQHPADRDTVFEAARRVKLVFLSVYDKAYIKYLQTFDGIFTIEFEKL